jgi:predicted Zn-dependent peptidase
MEQFRISQLHNGIRFITESLPGLDTVTFGVWTDMGARDEDEGNHGIAHFLEHMLFKGTPTHSPYHLAEAIERIGGQLNAYTERDATHLYARVLTDHLPAAVELLADMIVNSTFPPEEIERERQVVIEEIRKYELLGEERVHDLLMEGLWHNGALGHPILGNETSVAGFDQTAVLDCWRRHFSAERVIITAAGKLDHDDLAARVEDAFADLPRVAVHDPLRPMGEILPLLVEEDDEEQVNFCWGARTYPAHDERNFALVLVDAALGGSTTSRLFQEIREKRGLAYDVSSYTLGFKDTGLWCATGATSPDSFAEVVGLVRREILDLQRTGLPPQEFQRLKEQLKAGMALSLEGTAERMRRLAMHWMTWGEVYPLGYLMDRLERVTLEEAAGVMEEILHLDSWTFAAIGPLQEDDVRGLIHV